MIVIGHRGVCGHEPENTLRSFQKAIDMKLEMIEFDVHCCGTGEVVVIHDFTLEGTTNGKGNVSDISLEELKKLDAGKGEKVPTLKETIAFIDRRIKLNIELKGPNTALKVLELIEWAVNELAYDYSHFLVSSFNHRELMSIKSKNPEVEIGFLYYGIPTDLGKSGKENNAYSIHISDEFYSKEFVDAAKSMELKVFVYTINDQELLNKFNHINIDGFFSSYPDKFI